MRRLGPLAAWMALGACLTGGCAEDGPAAPEDVSGSYALVAVGGAGLPASVASGAGCMKWIEWGMLEMSVLGFFDLSLGQRAECTGEDEGAPPTTVMIAGRYTVEGNALVLTVGGFGRPEVEVRGAVEKERVRFVLRRDLGPAELDGVELDFRRQAK